jgi:hypothetical protein
VFPQQAALMPQLPVDFIPYSAVLKRLKTVVKNSAFSNAQDSTTAAFSRPKTSAGLVPDRAKTLANLRDAHDAVKSRQPQQELVEVIRRRLDEVHVLPDAREELRMLYEEFIAANESPFFDKRPTTTDTFMRASTATTASRPRTTMNAHAPRKWRLTENSAEMDTEITAFAVAAESPTLAGVLRLLRGLLRETSSADAARVATLLSLLVYVVQWETTSISRWLPSSSRSEADVTVMSTLERSASSSLLLPPVCIRKSVSTLLATPTPRPSSPDVHDRLLRFLLSKELRLDDPLEVSIRFLTDALGDVSRRFAVDSLANLLLDQSNESLRRLLGVCSGATDYLPLGIVRRAELVQQNLDDLRINTAEKLGNLPVTLRGLQEHLSIPKSRAHQLLALADDFLLSDPSQAVLLSVLTLDE